MSHMSRSRLLRVIAGTTVALLATAAPAFAHTTVSPGQVDPDAEVTLTFRAPPERQATNSSLRVLVPEQFVPGECTAPATWTCEFDDVTHAPHTLVTYQAPDPNLVTSVTFDLTVTAPSADAAGLYMFRALQDYSDGHTAPWAFEPGSNKPAPTVQVGDDDTLRNGPGSTNEPCFGPAEDPAEGEEPGPEQEPCPATTDTTADTTADDASTASGDPSSSDAPTAESTAPSADPAAAGAPATDIADAQLADTGGGAALLALGLFGAVSTLRRRS